MTFNLNEFSLSGHEKNELYRNDGDGFTRVGWIAGAGSDLDGRGFIPADFDRDGDLDLFIVNNNQRWQYLENTIGAEQSWLVVQLRGEESNHFGIGARIEVTAGGKEQVREMAQGAGFLSSPPPEAHFGLGIEEEATQIRVRWPSGKVQEISGVRARSVVVVSEGGSHQVRPLVGPAPDE